MKDMFDYYDDFVKEKSEPINNDFEDDFTDEADDIMSKLGSLANKIEEIERRLNNDGTDC